MNANYQRNAYVMELPEEMKCAWGDYAIVVDLVEPTGEVTHQMIGLISSYNNAKMDAANLNKWRDQTRIR